jgi:tetratricopeptide (TPR) repeat protein
MYLDREYQPRRRRPGFFGRFWPLLLLGAVAILFYQTRPNWLAPRVTMPTPTPTVSVVAYVAEAQNALSRGDYAAALLAHQKIAAIEPANPEPWITMSRLLMIEQDVQGAFDAATRAVELDAKNPNALGALARAEDWLGDFESALNHALDAYELDPQNVETLAILAEVYTDVGNQDIAQQYLDEALALDPNHVLALRNQAYLHEKMGKYDDALVELDRALAQDPQRADLFMEKARIYRVGKGEFAKAIEAYRAAVDANKTPVTLDALGEGLYNAGDHIQAVRILREAVEMDPNYGPALVHLGMALYARRNYEDAVTNLEKGLALIGDRAREDHLYTAGLAHINKEPRECALAEPWLRKALVENPASEPALAGLRICASQPAADTTEQTPP